jgi:hypothetical protein
MGGVEAYLHLFLISSLDGGEWSASRCDRFTPWKEGRIEDEKNLTLPEFELRTVKLVASRYTVFVFLAIFYMWNKIGCHCNVTSEGNRLFDNEIANISCMKISINSIQINEPTRCNNFLSLLLDHDQQHCYHHTPTVKPESATAVVKLLMMGVRTPETC